MKLIAILVSLMTIGSVSAQTFSGLEKNRKVPCQATITDNGELTELLLKVGETEHRYVLSTLLTSANQKILSSSDIYEDLYYSNQEAHLGGENLDQLNYVYVENGTLTAAQNTPISNWEKNIESTIECNFTR